MKMDRKPDPVQPAVWLIITGAINAALGLFFAIVALIQIIQMGESRIYSRDRSVHVLLLSDRSANLNLGAGGFE
jgi:hypothetical protein